jgi:hypothetical protein
MNKHKRRSKLPSHPNPSSVLRLLSWIFCLHLHLRFFIIPTYWPTNIVNKNPIPPQKLWLLQCWQERRVKCVERMVRYRWEVSRIFWDKLCQQKLEVYYKFRWLCHQNMKGKWLVVWMGVWSLVKMDGITGFPVAQQRCTSYEFSQMNSRRIYVVADDSPWMKQIQPIMWSPHYVINGRYWRRITSCMNFLQTGRISLLSVALNIITCFPWGVLRNISCTSRLMSENKRKWNPYKTFLNIKYHTFTKKPTSEFKQWLNPVPYTNKH